jgi:2-polyprenyl-3-methyl-5-hydroxy-6-metoxy-1,4-benzoquinol methylase
MRREHRSAGFGWIAGRSRSTQEAATRRVYSQPRLVSTYAQGDLVPAERAFFERFGDRLAGARILELGCGGGRLTRRLLERSDNVTGIDVSPAMVEYCQQRFDRGSFAVFDLRDLSAYDGESFDVVVAGANVLDAVPHEDRIATLASIRRIIRDGGLFYFSSHNRNSTNALEGAARGPRMRRSRSPYRQAKAAAAYVISRMNHRRLAQHQEFRPEYAILNDAGHYWALLHYYIDRDAQARQLAEAGFALLATFGQDGNLLGDGADDSAFTELHYVADLVSRASIESKTA